ncbi:hypothetical protein BDV09DRAFT_176492 [Aspergillus tetrazonus]
MEDLGEWEPERMQKYRQSVFVWPSSGKGVWVYEYNAQPRFRPRELLNALRNIESMDEQCALLEKWNATFYENPADYPPIADLFMDKKRSDDRREV